MSLKPKIPYPDVKQTTLDLYGMQKSFLDTGFHQIGKGVHSICYSKNDLSYVVKVGAVNCDNYINYVRLIGLNSPNTHFPCITSVEIYDQQPDTPFSDPYYVITMEKLRDTINADKAREYWMTLLGVEVPASVLRSNSLVMTKKLKLKSPAMQEVVDVLSHLYTVCGALFDLGGGVLPFNVMWREEEAVFTDPVV